MKLAPALQAPGRIVIRLGYRLVLLWWRLVGPVKVEGAQVVVWHEDRLLMVRHSYRRKLSLPGGRLKRGEPPREAARRELAEEVGIEAAAAELRDAGASTFAFEHGEVTVHLFEYRPAERPEPRLDRLEIVEAAFLEVEEALARSSNRHLRHYLGRDKGTSGQR